MATKATKKKTKKKTIVRVYETQAKKGLMLHTAGDERVAYLTPDGWLLLDDTGKGVAATRDEAERFVAGELGSVSNPLKNPRRVEFKVVPENELLKAKRTNKA